jgi:hypothetical protein
VVAVIKQAESVGDADPGPLLGQLADAVRPHP